MTDGLETGGLETDGLETGRQETGGQETGRPLADPGRAMRPEHGAWDDDPHRTRGEGAAPILSVEGFEGPLDWLLEMVRSHKIDLARLSILALVTAFATALERALAGRDASDTRGPSLGRPLGQWGDWLVMAANLTLLRSRLLLPADAAAARVAADEADRLRRQLVSRAAVGVIVDWLDGSLQLGRDVFARGLAGPHAAERASTITELLRACLVALRLPEGAEPYRPRPPPLWRVSDAIAHIEARLDRVPNEGIPITAFLPPIAAAAPQRDARCRGAVAATFLAGLELARGGRVVLDQARPWTPIQLYRTGRDEARQEAP